MKRLFDFTIACVALFLLFLPLMLIAFLIKCKLGKPFLFMQERSGLNGKSFKMIKFRSMSNDIGPDNLLLPDIQRLTPFGIWLRSTSIDELPELWNVILGEMSLVGPRPLLMQYLPLYTAEQFRRHKVRPGITGWAQVNGRNTLTWEEKFKLDVWYVDNQSFFLDLKIIYLTILSVLNREGIN
jgi:lipopolysaccharide/colanic/teichoic acid biosynthesis glycosyltransferase